MEVGTMVKTTIETMDPEAWTVDGSTVAWHVTEGRLMFAAMRHLAEKIAESEGITTDDLSAWCERTLELEAEAQRAAAHEWGFDLESHQALSR